MTRSQATHKLSGETSVRVYDNGGETLDRYSVVITGPEWTDGSPGLVAMLGLDTAGRGFSQFTEGKEGRHLGKLIAWTDLDDATRKHIESRLA
jgi:hypothetical protein